MQDNPQLIDAYFADKSQESFHALVLYYLPLADGVAKNYHRQFPRHDLDDVTQLARLVLVQHILKLKPNKTVSVCRYLVIGIKNYLMSDYLHTCRHNANCSSSVEEMEETVEGLSLDIPYYDRDERTIDPRIKDIKEVAAPAQKEKEVVDILLGNVDNLPIIKLEEKYGLPKGRIDNIKTRIKQKLFDVNYIDYYTVHSREYYQKNKARIKRYNHDRYHRKKKDEKNEAQIL